MSLEIKVPAAGESVTEAILSEWLKASGDFVKRDEPVLVLETDKASMEVVAEADGKLEVKAEEGDTVLVGQVIATIDTSAVSKSPGAEKVNQSSGAVENQTSTNVDTTDMSPAVRRMASESNIDISQVSGTGRGGRVTKGDLINFKESGASKPAATKTVTPTNNIPTNIPDNKPAVPQVKERVAMSRIRQKIAQRLVQAQQEAAILTTFNEVDMSALMGLRADYKTSFEKKYGIRLGFMGVFVKACVEALKAYPAVNSMIDGTDIIYQNFFNIGVAVSTPKGLMVPVVKNADQLSVAQIELKIKEFADKARAGRISIDDLSGGTFTISNGGVFGSMMSTPILNPPQTGILGMHKIEKRPVVVDDQVVVRPMMYLALSYDHRIIDGKESVSFLVRIKECIEDPQRILLEI